jgi:hypothetical protein
MFFNPISLQLQQHPWNWACENPSIEILFLTNLHKIYTYISFGSQIWWPHFLLPSPSKEMHRLNEKTGTRSCVGQSHHWNGTQIEAFLHPPAQIQQQDLKSEIWNLLGRHSLYFINFGKGKTPHNKESPQTTLKLRLHNSCVKVTEFTSYLFL